MKKYVGMRQQNEHGHFLKKNYNLQNDKYVKHASKCSFWHLYVLLFLRFKLYFSEDLLNCLKRTALKCMINAGFFILN